MTSAVHAASGMEGAAAIVATLPDLYCDLDGTLVSTDTLWESAVLYVRRHPLRCWQVLLWAARGPAVLKGKLAAEVVPDAKVLPYREEVLAFLRQEKAAGRRIVLATAAHARIANAVAEHLGVFDACLSTEGAVNLKGERKLAAIEGAARGRAFGYVGDSAADVPIWRAAGEVYVVGRAQVARGAAVPRRVFAAASGGLGAALRALRPVQWIKNLLVLVPLLASHRLGGPEGVPLACLAVLAFAAFSLAASAVYVVNDMLDIEADRTHVRKRRRPFAAGALSIPAGLLLAGAMGAGALGLSLWTEPRSFTLLLVLYLVLTSAYSMFFKRRLLQDVFLLAGLYTLRIIAGGAACGIEISFWLAAFSIFMFLSLAFIKRYAELLMAQDRDHRQVSGRDYLTDDIALIESMGPASGYMAVMVFCLYINSDMVRSMYRRPEILWALCPILLYWITRIWFLARRRVLADDPVVFAATDRVSLVLAAVSGAVMVLAAMVKG